MSFEYSQRLSKARPQTTCELSELCTRQHHNTFGIDLDKSPVILSMPPRDVRQVSSKLGPKKGLGFRLSVPKVGALEREPKHLSRQPDLPSQKALVDNPFSIPSPLLSLPTFFSSLVSHSHVPTAYETGIQSKSTGSDCSATSTFSDSRIFWLFMYFAFNLGITLLNKHVLAQLPFPYAVTAVHATFGSVGGSLLESLGYYRKARINVRQKLVLVAFSFVFTLNITVSNSSLHLVTIPFHQVVRAVTPIFTLMFSVVLMNTAIRRTKLLALLPVVTGVGFATNGNFSFTSWGFFLTLFGSILAALKGVLTSVLQLPSSKTGRHLKITSKIPRRPLNKFTFDILKLGLHPLDLVSRLSFLALIQCLVYSQVSGEMKALLTQAGDYITIKNCFALTLNGLVAFGINIVSFYANKKAGPLSMSVAANIKQVMTILLAVSLFDARLTHLNALGIVLSLVGGACYSYVEYAEKTARL